MCGFASLWIASEKRNGVKPKTTLWTITTLASFIEKKGIQRCSSAAALQPL
jgi:hypothetical protein